MTTAIHLPNAITTRIGPGSPISSLFPAENEVRRLQRSSSLVAAQDAPSKPQFANRGTIFPRSAQITFHTIDLGAPLTAIASRIASNPSGVFVLEPSPSDAPFGAIAQLFSALDANPDLAERANKAYDRHPVVKDPRARGTCAPDVDDKRCIDLSPARLATILENDPGLQDELGEPLNEAIAFFEKARVEMGSKVAQALALASKSSYDAAELRYNYRMIDYFPRPSEASVSPRCGAHRDFGPFTIIWQHGAAGLEVKVSDTWVSVPCGKTVLLFGICAAWRSNDRIHAAEHRVGNPPSFDGTHQARMSAVLFAGLAEDAPLSPSVLPGEKPNWLSSTAGEVHPRVRRKWQAREGTASLQEAEEERVERSTFGTQEQLLEALYRA